MYSLPFTGFLNTIQNLKKKFGYQRETPQGASLAFLSGLPRKWVWRKRCDIPHHSKQHLKHIVVLALFIVHLLLMLSKSITFEKPSRESAIKAYGSVIVTSKTLLIADSVISCIHC